ncbi:MAG: DNA repair protein RecN [Brumimicrobium sp.]
MLSQLSVKNFALIENANLQLNDGFTVITGETGSGKSILLGALRLILGERADYSVIRDKEKKTVVEAFFQLDSDKFGSFFTENGLDFDTETIIRREINSNGKSRAFINDTPVQLSLLKSLTEKLVYIHSQHHTLELMDKNFQQSILDILGDNQPFLEELKRNYEALQNIEKEIKTLSEKKAKQELELDFNTFQLEELKALQLEQLDFEQIKNEVERGEQFEEIKSAYQLVSLIINDDNGILEMLQKIFQFSNLSDANLKQLYERIQSVIIELKDIGDTADDELSNMSFEPEELIQFTHKLDAFNTALRKHNLSSQDELLELFQKLSNEVSSSEEIDSLIQEKEKEKSEKLMKANQIAKQLSESRKKIAKSIEKDVKELLSQLELEGATIRFKFLEKELNNNGIDKITLFFAPNKGISEQVIEKSASGGELSRLMLVFQYLLSQKQQLPTIIFDEIDAGVSGKVAQKIGTHLKNMGERMQLFAITHLPQVASKGKNHILVEKQDVSEITTTKIYPLNNDERIKEIAKLMSGDVINEAAITNAKNLLNE